ncbi:MAG: hypothetical protein ABI811_15890 [Acidobacteriota bacterium]
MQSKSRRSVSTCVRTLTLWGVVLGSALCASAQTSIDFQADGIEITQGLQDLDHTVRLVANRFTFVKFYAHIKSGATSALAEASLTIIPATGTSTNIAAERGARTLTNKTAIDRQKYFLFRIPPRFTTGRVEFRARINTNPPDPDFSNNSFAHAMTFEDVPAPKVNVFQMHGADAGCTKQVAAPTDIAEKLLEYGYLVMPVSGLAISDQGLTDGNQFNPDGDIQCGALWTSNGSAFANQDVARIRAQARANDPAGFDPDVRYFAFVSGNPTYFRGAALYPGGAPVGSAAAGPPGTAANASGKFVKASRGYDMAGWVGAHELGHSYGLYHAENGCGETNTPSVPFPYANAYISPTVAGADSDIWGFNVLTMKSYLATSRDFMSYCMNSPGQWISKQSYHRLMDSLINNWRKFPVGDKGWPDSPRTAEIQSSARQASGPAMLISGIINLTNPGQSRLQPILSATAPIPDPVTGSYSVVLKAGAAEVGRTVLEAGTPVLGPPLTGAPTPDETPVFAQWIPFVAGVTSVEIQGPLQQVFVTRRAGLAIPTVRITAPNGGENLTANTINLSWTASDADFDDRLVYEVAFSTDNGATWKSILDGGNQTTVAIPRTSLPGCTQCLFRVTATDGIHSASDVSDAVFTLPNQTASIAILSPVAGAKAAPNYPIELLARVADSDRPFIAESEITWTTSIGGALGSGRRLNAVLVGVGKHLITATVTDPGGTAKSATVEVDVVASAAALSPKDMTRLEVDQELLEFTASAPAQTYQVAITSQNDAPGAELTWTATASAPWVRFGTATGTTPGSLQVQLGDISGLPVGTTGAQVTISAAGLPTVLIPVIFEKPAPVSSVTLDVGGAVNAADYSHRSTAGMIASVFGKGFATKVTAATEVPLLRTLDGVSVEVIDGATVTLAPLYFVSPTQINFQMPAQITSSVVKVRVKNALGVSGEELMPITRNQPTLFTRDLSGTGQAIAIRSNYTFVEASSPLRPGEYAFVYLTALGPVSPTKLEGNPAGDNATLGPINLATDQISIKFAGQTLPSLFTGLAPGLIGVFQVNFQVPAVIDDTTCSFRVVANGVESQGGVSIPCKK